MVILILSLLLYAVCFSPYHLSTPTTPARSQMLLNTGYSNFYRWKLYRLALMVRSPSVDLKPNYVTVALFILPYKE